MAQDSTTDYLRWSLPTISRTWLSANTSGPVEDNQQNANGGSGLELTTLNSGSSEAVEAAENDGNIGPEGQGANEAEPPQNNRDTHNPATTDGLDTHGVQASKKLLEKETFVNFWTIIGVIVTAILAIPTIIFLIRTDLFSQATEASQFKTTKSQQFTINSTAWNDCLKANQSGYHSEYCDQILNQGPPHTIILRVLKRSLKYATTAIQSRSSICDDFEYSWAYADCFLLTLILAFLNKALPEFREFQQILAIFNFTLAIYLEIVLICYRGFERPYSHQALSVVAISYTFLYWWKRR